MPIKIGKDDFCSNCMEWRDYDEEGRCKVCGKIIKKIISEDDKNAYERYKSEPPNIENDDESENEY
jgi:hypothetical protein